MKIQLLTLICAACGLSLPEIPSLPDLVGTVESSVHGNFTEQTIEEPQAFLPTIAKIRSMTDQERAERLHWFLSVFLLVFLCVVISGTVIMVVGAELKALGSYQSLGHTAPLSKGAQVKLVILSFGGTVLLSFAACLWSLQTGRLSKTLGLDWEVYLVLFCCAGASLLVQAVLAVAWLKAGDRFDATAFAAASFSSMAPFISDQFDTLKDVIFGGLCWQSPHVFMKIVGVLSWLYLLAIHARIFWLSVARKASTRYALGANCFNELAASHLSVLLIAPKVQDEWSGGFWEGMIIPTIYKQVAKSKRQHLLIESVPQALMSVLFLAVEGGSCFVAALNLLVPGVQIALSILLFKKVRAAAIPALGKRLSRAMKGGNTVAAAALWHEVFGPSLGSYNLVHGIAPRGSSDSHWGGFYGAAGGVEEQLHQQREKMKEDMRNFWLMLPHLTFFLDVMKRCEFMKEELKDLDKLSLKNLDTLQRMVALFAGQVHCRLEGQKIGVCGAKVVAEALRSSTKEWLWLDDNAIGDEGAEALAEALRNNRNLRGIFLASNDISDRGAEALAESLKVNSSLLELFLASNDISDRGAEALAESLKVNSSLQYLRLDDNIIGDDGAQALAAGLMKNRSLLGLGLGEYGSSMWGLWHTLGRQALDEAEKIKQERGDKFFISWE